MLLKWWGDITKNITDFSFLLDGPTLLEAYRQMLLYLGSLHVSALDVDFICERYSNENGSTLPSESLFLDFIKQAPQVEELHFTDATIKNIEPGSLILQNLSKQVLRSALIEKAFFLTLIKMAPKLTRLELDSYLTVDGNKLYQKITHTNMPSTSFFTLSLSNITANYIIQDDIDPFYKHYLFILQSAKLGISIFIRLENSSDQDAVQDFMQQKGELPMITEEEFVLYSKIRPTVHINCYSISELVIDMEPFDLRMCFNNGKLENGSRSVMLELEEREAALERQIRQLKAEAAQRMITDRSRRRFVSIRERRLRKLELQNQ